MNVAEERFSYDQLHYIGKSYLQTHPDRLASFGQLHGMHPAPSTACRVLELACGDGSNLIPMAYALPGSSFHGIDLAAGPLEFGLARATNLGLTNLRLEAMDLLNLPADLGEFDYIIAHGFYSWCPPEVGDRILAVCAEHLAPQGIAFVSFNAYPGYHVRDLQRHLMLYHVDRAGGGTPAEQARQALEALDFVAYSQNEDNPCRAMLLEAREHYEKEFIKKGAAGLAWFHHDLLATYNRPAYFHDFAAHAKKHGLQYLCDATLRIARMLEIKPEALRVLETMKEDVLTQEQYLDFISNIPFRQVLLCREDVVLDRSTGPAGMQDLYIAGKLEPEPPAAAADPEAPEIFMSRGGKVAAKHPDARGALHRIGATWPHAVSFQDLLTRQSPAGTPLELAEFLLRLCVNKFASFRSEPGQSALQAGDRPEASAVARLQAQTSTRVTNLYHETIDLEPPLRHLIPLLDGTRDRATLLREMRAWITSGQAERDYAAAAALAALDDSEAAGTTSSPPPLDTLEESLEATLRSLVSHGLLVG